MRIKKTDVARREQFAYEKFVTPDTGPDELPFKPRSAATVQAMLRLPENGGMMMSPGRIYAIMRAARNGEPLPPTKSLSKKPRRPVQ